MSSGYGDGASFAVAEETTFATPDATNPNVIDPSGLTWLQCYPNGTSIGALANAMKQGVYKPQRVSASGGGAQRIEPEAGYTTTFHERLKGSFDVEMDLRFMGSSTLADTALGVLLRSFLHHRSQTAGATVTPQTSNGAGGTFTVLHADIAKFEPGDVFAFRSSGRLHFRAVVSVNSGTDTVTFHPTSPELDYATSILLCHVFVPVSGAGAASGPSFACRYEDRNRTIYALGCRVSAVRLTFTGDDSRTPVLTFAIVAADGAIDSAPVAIASPKHFGVSTSHAAKFLVASCVYSEDYTPATPITPTDAQDLSMTEAPSIAIESELTTDGGFGLTRAGQSDWSIKAATCTVTARLKDSGSWESMIYDEEHRTIIVPIPGPTAAGCGMAVVLPNAEPVDFPSIEVGDRITSIPVVFAGGEFSGDDGSAVQANTHFRLAFVA